MTFKPLVPVTLLVALAGCNVAVPAGAPGAAAVAARQDAAGASASPAATLPFKTLAIDNGGQGNYFKAGTTETVVLRSQADLDAFIARHEPAVKPQFGPPNPSASVGPPSGIPFGTPEPPYRPAALPNQLKQVDWTKYEVIAFFDGTVKVASHSRIIAVQDQGDTLVASTQRWEPPPNPDAIPDIDGRLHIIALARTDKPVTFRPTTVVDGSAPPGGGGYSVGGNPVMHPRWTAVPNPALTRDQIEQMVRGFVHGAIGHLDLQLAPIASAQVPSVIVGGDAASGTDFTLDSQVWVARITDSSVTFGPSFGGPSPGVGGGPPTYPETLVVLSPEDGHIMEATTRGPATPPSPGFGFHLKPEGDLHLGDTLTFDTTGVPPADGSVTMTISSDGAAPVIQQIAYKDLASFHQFLDAAHLPLLTGADVQNIAIELKYKPNADQEGTETHPIHVFKADVKPQPEQPIQGPNSLAEYHPLPGETAADAYVRLIASQAWRGTNLTYTSTMSTIADVHPKGREAIDLNPTTPCRVYTVRGTFQTMFVPSNLSTADQDQVMTPDHLEVAVTEALPIRTVSVRAFPR